jgi:hypothetical protein
MLGYNGRVEYAGQRKIRTRNKFWYRVAHWPIWIFVFFLAPGPLTFELFAKGPTRRNGWWLGAVLIGTGVTALRGKLPGVEPRPYILRFSEDRRNPLYRRICYTFAWNALLSFALLNLLALAAAAITGRWRMRQIYTYGYLPSFLAVVSAGLFAVLPRVRRSTVGEGTERRYFYAAVWAISVAQTLLLILWKMLPRTHAADIWKLVLYVGVLAGIGVAAMRGLLPRTRPILPGELMVAD